MLERWLGLGLLVVAFTPACSSVEIDPDAEGGGGGGVGPQELPLCEALETTMPPGVSRWHFDYGDFSLLSYPPASELVDTGLDGEHSTVLLTLAAATDGSSALLASSFDGRAQGSDSSELLPRTAIPLGAPSDAKRILAVRGAAGEIVVLLSGDTSARLLRLDARDLTVISSDDLGGGALPTFMAASEQHMLAGMHPLPGPSPLSLVSDEHLSLSDATPLGCEAEFRPAGAVATDDGFLLAYHSTNCPALGEDGIYVAEVVGNVLTGALQRLELPPNPWLPVLTRVGDVVWLTFTSSEAAVNTVIQTVPLDMHGAITGEVSAIGLTSASVPTTRVGGTVVVGEPQQFGTTLQLLDADSGDAIGDAEMGSGGDQPSFSDVEGVGNDTLLTSWVHTGKLPHDGYLHIEQLRCVSAE